MNTQERMQILEKRLQEKFSPATLEVIDDSHKHVGHTGSAGGAGHYTVVISAEHFKDKSRVDAHREIYQLFDDLIPDEVHALRIKIL